MASPADHGWRRKVAFPICVILSLLHLYTAQFGIFPLMLQRAGHFTIIAFLVFLLYPLRKERTAWMDVIDVGSAALALIAFGYIAVNYDDISTRMGLASPVSEGEFVLGIIAFWVILEGARRTVGLPLSLVVLFAVVYVYAGPYFPGRFAHRGYSITDIIAFMYLSFEGVFGVAMGVSSTYAILFIIFGAFLYMTGVGNFFIRLAASVSGRSRGGPAKIAVIASAFFGTISGATMANVYGTGSFTIPMMKRLGYRAEFAAAVEAVASTGGQIMPPVMGAVAFVMAEVAGYPYVEVAIAAALPACLYYLALLMMVHFRAVKRGLRGLPKEEVAPFGYVVKNSYLLIPVVFLVVILIQGYTPFRAAFLAILATIVVSAVRKENWIGLKGILLALEKGARDAIMVACACAAAGVVVGAVSMTGLGIQVTGLILELSRETLIIPLILTMIACIILGTGLPTVPAYIITATLAVPTLVKLGVPLMAAHMFALYFAIISVITPPVAVAAYGAAGIAGANMWKTGITATQLGIVAYVVPYMFAYNPALLLMGSWERVVLAAISGIFGVTVLAAGLERFLFTPMKTHEVILFVLGGLLLMTPGWRTDLIGVFLVTGGFVGQYLARSRRSHEIASREDLPP